MKEVLIEKLDHQGRGIAFIDNVITFIPDCLPGEVVKIKLIKKSKKINEGEVVEFIKKSSNRVESICKYNKLCGGCDLLHISYEDELNYKENKVKEIINRFTHIDINKVKKIIPNNEYNYRNKATFHIKEKVGYYKKKTYEVINIDKCLIVDDKINELLNLVKKNNLRGIYQILIRVSKNDSMIVLKVDGNYKIDKSLFEDKVTSLVIYENKKYKNIIGNGYIIEEIGEYKFYISPDSFFQVNTKGAFNLYSKVYEYVNKSDNLLDLYCGTGTIGIFLSKICKNIYGVEINEYAIKDANKNKELNNISNIKFECNDVINMKEIKNIDTIVLDPPRSGLDKTVVQHLLNLEVDKIVYVSCDPVTLARDLNLLSEKYNIVEITPVDMFSKTYHVECVVKLLKI
ncbi:MAG: class I SAM-dependent RNA methyltransferase [Bacilli bacterium]|nr:class I SAM-dependent RNA methyltransferase [Bacilli bacterium]